MNSYEDPSKIIRLKKLPVGGLPVTFQQLEATNSKTKKPTATIIAINHINKNPSGGENSNYKTPGGENSNFNSYPGHYHDGHYVKNGGGGHSFDRYQNGSNCIKNEKSAMNLYNHERTFEKYNGSLGTPSVTPSTTASSPSPCSSPRPSMVQTPPRSSSLVKNNSKSLSNLHHGHHGNKETMSSSMSTRRLNHQEPSDHSLEVSENQVTNQNQSKVSKVPKVSSGLLDEQEVLQIELNFKSHKTFVYVCRCLANLYFTRTDLIQGGRVSSPRSNEWELNRTGVPVVVFDEGESRSRPRRQVQLILAERGSGFPLWRDVIDNLTDYRAIASTFHTLYLSSDHRLMAGLSFDSTLSAADFLLQVDLITSDPVNIALTGPKGRKGRLSKSQERERKRERRERRDRRICKSEISAPCLFQHVTSVDLSDFDRLFTVSTLMLPRSSELRVKGSGSEGSGSEGLRDGAGGAEDSSLKNGPLGGEVINQKLINQRLSQLKIDSTISHSSSSPPPSVSSSVSTIDFDSSPVPSPSLQLPIPVPPPLPPINRLIGGAVIKGSGPNVSTHQVNSR